jgi:hypothetical protein
MRQLFFIVAFWIVVVVAMRLAVSFPRSLLARVFFTPFGPEPRRGEPRSDYLLRCARFGVGWIALEWNASLAESLFFMVLWAVVTPLLGAGALVVSIYALCRCFWIRSFGRTLTRIQS